MRNSTEYKKTYRDIFKEINNTDYVDRVDLVTKTKNKRNKNLVFIVIESYEQNLIKDDFTDISKDIIRYSKSGEFFQI